MVYNWRQKIYPPTQKATPACRNFYRERKPKTALQRAGMGFSRKKMRKPFTIVTMIE